MALHNTIRSLLLGTAVTVLVGCGAEQFESPPAATGVVVEVAPPSITLPPAGNTIFTAAVTGTAVTSVRWTVQEASGGTIDSTGNYVAPASAGTFHVMATSSADPAISATATVTVTPGPGATVSVAVVPATVSVPAGGTTTFAASVSGSPDQAVTWIVQETSSCGSVSSTGTYTAPGTPTTCHVLARSVADPAATAVATVTVTEPAATGIVVTVNPQSVSMAPSGAYTFSANVTGTAATSVAWSVQETACGSITSSGVFTAPPSPAICHIQARSTVDSSKLGVATAIVTAAASSAQCAAEPIRTTGTTYYFCDCGTGAQSACVPGNDANAGTSPTAPKRTAGAARTVFNSMAAGSTVALCKGGSFTGFGGDLFNPRCAASSTCDIRDYSPPTFAGTNRPILAATGQTAIAFNSGSANLADGGYRVLNLDLEGGGTYGGGGRGVGIQFYNSVVDTLVCNNVIRGFGNGIEVANGDTRVADTSQGGISQRIQVVGNEFYNNGMGFIGGGNDFVIAQNLFDHNGSFSTQSHTIYLAAPANGTPVETYRVPAERVKVIGNKITNTNLGSGTTCGGPGFVVHTRFIDLTVEGNYIDVGPAANASCIALDIAGTGYPNNDPQFFRQVVVRGNWFKSASQAIAIAQAPNPVIENNVIWGPANGDGNPINVPSEASTAARGDDNTTNVVVRNNTLYLAGGTFQAIKLGDTAQGNAYVVTGNVIYNSGTSSQYTSCFWIPSTTIFSGGLMNNNVCFSPSVDKWDQVSGRSFASWKSATGLDAASGNGDPKFAGAPGDLRPGTGSPLRGAASTAATCTIRGVPNQACSSSTAVPAATWTFGMEMGSRVAPWSAGAYEP